MAISKANIKKIKSLHNSKFRKEERLFIVEGRKSVEEAMSSGWKILHLLTTESENVTSKMEMISEIEMQQISCLSSPSSYLAVVQIPLPTLFDCTGKILYLDGVRDPGNLGTIIRTADWLGWNKIVLSSDCVELWNPKAVQSTMGSLFRMQIIKDEQDNWLSLCSSNNVEIWGADLNGVPLMETSPNRDVVLVMGSESHGIKSTAAGYLTHKVNIPSKGQAESLNVAIAAAIIMHQWS
jgi:TrmH family RNA methyltransferase